MKQIQERVRTLHGMNRGHVRGKDGFRMHRRMLLLCLNRLLVLRLLLWLVITGVRLVEVPSAARSQMRHRSMLLRWRAVLNHRRRLRLVLRIGRWCWCWCRSRRRRLRLRRNERVRGLAREVSSGQSVRGSIAILDFGERTFVRNRMKVRLSGSIGKRLAGRGRTSHHLDEVRTSTKEELVVVTVAIGSLRDDAAESPSVCLTDEGGELGVLEVGGDDLDFEFTRLQDLPRTSMRQPGDDIREILATQDGVHFGREVRDSSGGGNGGGGIRVRKGREVTVVKVRMARLLGLLLLLGRLDNHGFGWNRSERNTVLAQSHGLGSIFWGAIIEARECIENSPSIVVSKQ
mmetsp:Transcript_11800/g.18913  ORF Transcript_11800/g.18913 Transcript_11800/m.18913 type:complete len:346 (+) Transcript_11800:367-1404(+)